MSTKQRDKTLPGNIRFLRKRAGFSQEELAIRLDISRSNVAAYESKGVEPRLRIILDMAKLFDVDLRTFVAHDLATLTEPIAPFVQSSGADSKMHHIDISDSEALQSLMSKTIQVRKVVEGFKAYQEMQSKVEDRHSVVPSLPYDAGSFLILLDQLVSHNEVILSSVSRTTSSR